MLGAERRYFCAGLLWHEAAYLAGKITDEQFLAQPADPWKKANLLFYKAVRHDCLEDAGALTLYRAYAALQSHVRERDPVIDLFVRWRIERLQVPGES